MCDILASINWSDTIKSVSSIVTAVIAVIALNTWKQQTKAKNRIDFLDGLTESVHEFIQSLILPVEILKTVQIGLKSFAPLPNDEFKNNAYAKIISYIERAGQSDSTKLFNALKKCNDSINSIQSLLAKGQIYNFVQYNNCQNSCNMLLWQFQRLQAAALVIGSNSMNWENEVVQKSLDNLLSVSSEDVEKHIKEQHIKFLEFIKISYQAAY